MSSKDALQQIPGIGPSLAQDLRKLGYGAVKDLQNADPEEMYSRLCALCGKQDPCVLYAFRCAVYFAQPGPHDPEKLKWWYWKDR